MWSVLRDAASAASEAATLATERAQNLLEKLDNLAEDNIDGDDDDGGSGVGSMVFEPGFQTHTEVQPRSDPRDPVLAASGRASPPSRKEINYLENKNSVSAHESSNSAARSPPKHIAPETLAQAESHYYHDEVQKDRKEIERLAKVIRKLEIDNEKLKEDSVHKDQKMKALRDQIEHSSINYDKDLEILYKEKTEVKHKCDKAEAELKSSKTALSNSIKTAESLNAQLKQQAVDTDKLREVNMQLESENATLLRQISEAETKAETLSNIEQEMRDLETYCNSLQEAIAQLRDENADLEEKASSAAELLEVTVAGKIAVESELKLQNQQVSVLTKAMEDTIQAHKIEIEAAGSQQAANAKQATSELDSARGTIDHLRREVETLNASLVAQNTINLDLESEILKVRNDLSVLQTQHHEGAQEEEKEKAEEDALAASRSRVADLQAELKAAREEIELLQGSVESLEATVEELAVEEQSAEGELEKAGREQVSLREKLQEEHQHVEEETVEIGHLHAQIAALAEEVASLTGERDSLMHSLLAAEAKVVDSAGGSINNSGGGDGNTEDRDLDFEQNAESQQALIQTLTKDLQASKEASQQLESQLRAQEERAAAETESLQQTLQNLKKQREEELEARGTLLRSIEELKAELTDVRAAVHQRETSILEAAAETERIESLRCELEREVDELARAKSDLEGELESANLALADAEKELTIARAGNDSSDQRKKNEVVLLGEIGALKALVAKHEEHKDRVDAELQTLQSAAKTASDIAAQHAEAAAAKLHEAEEKSAKQLHVLQEQLDDLTTHLDQAQTERAGAVTSVEKCTERISELEELLAQCKGDEVSASAQAFELSQARERCGKLSKEVSSLQNNVQGLTQELQAQQTKHEEDMTVYRENLNVKESQLSDLEQTHNAVLTELQRVNELRSELEAKLQEAEQRIISLEESRTQVTSRLQEVERAFNERSALLAKAESAAEHLQSQLCDSQAQYIAMDDQLQQRVVENASLHERLRSSVELATEATKRAAAAEKQVDSLTNNLRDATAELSASLSQKSEALANAQQAQRTALDQISSLESSRDTCLRENEQLKDRLTDLEQRLDAVDEELQQTAELRKRAEEAEMSLQTLDDKKHRDLDALRKQNEKIAAMQRAYGEFKREHEETVQTLQWQVESRVSELAECEAQLLSVRKRMLELETTLQHQQEQQGQEDEEGVQKSGVSITRNVESSSPSGSEELSMGSESLVVVHNSREESVPTENWTRSGPKMAVEAGDASGSEHSGSYLVVDADADGDPANDQRAAAEAKTQEDNAQLAYVLRAEIALLKAHSTTLETEKEETAKTNTYLSAQLSTLQADLTAALQDGTAKDAQIERLEKELLRLEAQQQQQQQIAQAAERVELKTPHKTALSRSLEGETVGGVGGDVERGGSDYYDIEGGGGGAVGGGSSSSGAVRGGVRSSVRRKNAAELSSPSGGKHAGNDDDTYLSSSSAHHGALLTSHGSGKGNSGAVKYTTLLFRLLCAYIVLLQVVIWIQWNRCAAPIDSHQIMPGIPGNGVNGAANPS